jgi:streptomycin 3"-adenylyltransferase
MSDTYPEIVAHWDEDADERNQILALCRIYFSLVMKDIASKDNAARWVMPQLPPEQKFVLQRLIQEYRGKSVNKIGKRNIMLCSLLLIF